MAVILVGGSGLAIAATLHLRRLTALVLAAYVLAFAEVVALMLILSAFGAMTRMGILVGVAALFGVSMTLWVILGAPRPRPLPPFRHHLRALACDRILLVLAVATGLALLYVLALIVGTPPNSWDSMTYHLARAAFWRQGDGVGYIDDAYDERLNVNPPNAEIALTFVLEVGRNERLSGFVQLLSALAISLGVYALARKVRLSRREAVGGALLFLTLPIVLLQASTTQNDLVAASFLVVAAVFILGESRGELGIAALATALAVGTKFPAAYGLTILGMLALVAPASPIAGRTRRFVALLVGAGVGSYWYAANVIQTGHPLGNLSDTAGVVALLEPTENLLATFARILDAFDLPGAQGVDIFIYGFVASVVAVALLLGERRGGRNKILPSLVTGALVIVPLMFVPVGYALWRVFAKLHDILEEPDGRLPVSGWEAQTTASESLSWFGPLGPVFVAGTCVAAVVLVRRGSLPPLAAMLAAAPLIWFALLSVSLAYDPWQGRFLIFPVALSASLWGLVLRVHRYAVAAVAVGATSAALSLVHYLEKPSGLALLERPVSASIWNVDRSEAQAVRREMRPVLSFIENDVPSDAMLALAMGTDDFAYPAFGPGLDRNVELVPLGSNARDSRAEWLLANAERASEMDRECWDAVLATPEGWIGFRRRAGACE